jgi:hypothetical protein
MSSLSRVRKRSHFLLAIWGFVVVSGILFLEAYAARPGDLGTRAGRWLAQSQIQLDDRRLNLLIFLHPQCPCSRASLGELAYIMDRCRDRVSVHAVLLGTPFLDRWGQSEIARDLARLPTIRIYPDRGGVEARRFGVATSGHALLYDPGGQLLFSGGITSARGHAGDNCGRAAVLDHILNNKGGQAGSSVFGCPLTTPRSTANEECRR